MTEVGDDAVIDESKMPLTPIKRVNSANNLAIPGIKFNASASLLTLYILYTRCTYLVFRRLLC